MRGELAIPNVLGNDHTIGARPLSSLREGEVWIDPDYRRSLQREGLATFSQITRATAGTVLDTRPDGRENRRLVLRLTNGERRDVYLKIHRVRTWRTRLFALLEIPIRATASWVEVENMARLKRDGIETMRLIAFGERIRADGWQESFMLTEGLKDYEVLEHDLKRKHDAGLGARDQEYLRMIDAVADAARRFHRAGYNHRDFYTTHFYLRSSEDGHLKVNLIDLQRVQRRCCFRRRWLVKDLAQLTYSSGRCASRTQQMRFVRRYLGVSKLRARDKLFVRSVMRKLSIMRKRLGPHRIDL